MEITSRIVSSLEKCFLDRTVADYEPLRFIRMMKNQRLSVQLIHRLDGDDAPHRSSNPLEIEGALAACATARTVEQVPVTMPTFEADENYLRTDAFFLCPDWLQPLHYGNVVPTMRGQLRSVWITFDPQDSLPAGVYETVIRLGRKGEAVAEQVLTVEILDADLPEQETLVTQWFHCDCLANYYGAEPWSERHWAIVENFARVAVKNGINVLLTPLLTPPLDTMVGGERTTVQLLDVTVTDGQYAFGFDKVDRWVDMCDRIGIRYFEINHLFTQWGAAHAPKVMATVDGEYKRIFGWDTEAAGAEYARFLREMLTAFLGHLKARGDGSDKRCRFHISDEPQEAHLDQYRAAKAIVADILEGYPVMDALSNLEFYQAGLVGAPVPCVNAVEAFYAAGVPDLWTYYACGPCTAYSNRFLAMPLWRTRCIGMQFFKYDIKGFLQWGFNFYSNNLSGDPINPYVETSGDGTWPGGDPFSVYPAQDGTALESIRLISFYEGLEDVRAMRLCASFYGRDRVIAELEKVFGREIHFTTCAVSSAQMLALRARVDAMIADALEMRK